jgi:hypothetical protein
MNVNIHLAQEVAARLDQLEYLLGVLIALLAWCVLLLIMIYHKLRQGVDSWCDFVDWTKKNYNPENDPPWELPDSMNSD